LFKT